jgi:hypothetical protein
MKLTAGSVIRFSIATILTVVALSWSGNSPLNKQTSLVSSAEAIIGRPLTPFSYAGVARRTTARAVGYGMAAGAVYGGAVYGAPVVVVAPPPMVVAPSCVQAVDPYGRFYTRCY